MQFFLCAASRCRSALIPSVYTSFALLLAPAMAASAQTIPGRGEPFAEARSPLPHRVFASSKFSVDRILAHPYDSDVPFGSSGDTIWATSPQGWGFREGVNYLYYSN